MQNDGNIIRITNVEVLGGYVIRLIWDDGAEREIDLRDELTGPIFEPLRDPDIFGQVKIDPDTAVTVVWPNGADLAPEFLRGPLPHYRDERAAS